ncbi:probable E3 ubiquitin-protein ligase BAH1-like 1 [Elaeis guineensis]|uniref:RING-type E3 ubiquitin transferase n=1 Tax=Elaeis guineensis var. tenera TaxID=51953 RepID=A0A6J0PR82_ELAGV|nr:probable E3 ubiquitin-protein ligase BAH1-like 1 isoform X1 [Elaeis guineensis]XP_010938403.1 probable E3 ubiquitin-protein ligase BAH1-like 1 isoform X1 [Elaeis guineensis]XP_019710422.1 probable E3 ubiquitin-protein ligase BAH1-like 1 isoform X1 [Elaeis guineensis]XP_029124040.1 probable E3 ubiquitin-protein ligase BAH1-like 1 isoform X1 [Elaeis guineensis]
MKFCKRYEEYMQGRREKELPVVGLKKLKKILKQCRRDFQSQNQHGEEGGGRSPHGGDTCPDRCPVCDGTFFPSLLKEMSAVVGCFNERAQKLLELHLASGFRKYMMWFRSKSQRNHGALIQEGKDLVTYALINSIAMRKILKKYDKVHYSKQGQAFRSQAQSMHIEILQSPWLCELMAFYINLRQCKANSKAFMGLFEDCSLTFDDDKPMLSCGLFDSMKVDIGLTCSICLDTVFDPVSLTCGHIFCFMCCCSAGSVSIVDGLKTVGPKAKCPLCRQAGVYAGAVHLDELNILLSRSCPDYWEERLRSERVERVRRTKEHWQSQCRAFLGV